MLRPYLKRNSFEALAVNDFVKKLDLLLGGGMRIQRFAADELFLVFAKKMRVIFAGKCLKK